MLVDTTNHVDCTNLLYSSSESAIIGDAADHHVTLQDKAKAIQREDALQHVNVCCNSLNKLLRSSPCC